MAPEVETFAQSIGHYEEHEVVLHEERPVVEKDVLPKERVRLATDTVTDEQQVSEQLRKDRIETEGDIGIGRGRMTEVRLGGSATVSSEPAGALPGRPVAEEGWRRRNTGKGVVRATVALVIVVALSATGLVGCNKSANAATNAANSDCQTTAGSDIRFAKTKFVLHAGLAFGAFHRYIYKPYKNGSFQAGASGRVKTFVKAALAGAFVYHEVRLAAADAQADPTLSRLAAPVTALGQRLQAITSSLRTNNANPQDVEAANTQLEGVRQQSAAAGAPITDQQPNNVPSNCS